MLMEYFTYYRALARLSTPFKPFWYGTLWVNINIDKHWLISKCSSPCVTFFSLFFWYLPILQRDAPMITLNITHIKLVFTIEKNPRKKNYWRTARLLKFYDERNVVAFRRLILSFILLIPGRGRISGDRIVLARESVAQIHMTCRQASLYTQNPPNNVVRGIVFCRLRLF